MIAHFVPFLASPNICFSGSSGSSIDKCVERHAEKNVGKYQIHFDYRNKSKFIEVYRRLSIVYVYWYR